jgi:ABC-2 type transport system ATP-binding protein
MSPPVIVVKNLEKYFPPAVSGWRAFLQPVVAATQRALAGISFSVEAGEAVALVGANGAGKSTLLRILATLVTPTRGRATLGGRDVESESAAARSQLGYHTGGDEGFYGRLSGRANLSFFAAMNNLDGARARERITEVAGALEISDCLDRQVRTYSTGMTHRLGLARALLHRPPVLLLDEPTRSLDPLAASDFRHLLRDQLVRRQGATLLFASHTPSEVEQVADRIVLLDDGNIIAFDSPAGIRAAAGSVTLAEAIETLMRRAKPSETIVETSEARR